MTDFAPCLKIRDVRADSAREGSDDPIPMEPREAAGSEKIMTKQTTTIAPRKPVLGAPADVQPNAGVKVIPSRLEPTEGFEPVGENVLASIDADGILTLRIDTRARLGRTGKGLGPNLTIAGTAGAISLGMTGKLTLTAYAIAGFRDERPKGERR